MYFTQVTSYRHALLFSGSGIYPEESPQHFKLHRHFAGYSLWDLDFSRAAYAQQTSYNLLRD